MKKSELVAALAARVGVPRRVAKEAVDLIFETMARTLAEGGRIEIRGLGTFRVHQYDGYKGRNPKTREPVDVLPKRLPLFRPSRLLNPDGDE